MEIVDIYFLFVEPTVFEIVSIVFVFHKLKRILRYLAVISYNYRYGLVPEVDIYNVERDVVIDITHFELREKQIISDFVFILHLVFH